MKDKYKTKEQLIKELTKLRKKLSDLQTSGNGHKRTDELSSKNGAYFQTLLNALPDVIYFKDIKGRNTIVNKAFQEFVGLNRTEIIGKTDEHLFTPELARQCADSDREVLKSGRTLHFEEECTNKDGKKLLFNTIKSPVYDDQRNIVGLVGVSRYITEYRQTLDDLQLFKNLINQTNDAVVVIDPETGKFLYINDKTCNNLGYTRAEMLKMGVTDIEAILPDNFSWSRHVSEVREKGYMLLEGLHKRKDGTTFPVWVNVKFLTIGENNYMVAVARDIIEWNRMKNELERANKEFEQRVIERTTQLEEANKQLKDEVTAHKLSEENLKKSEVHYRSLVETSPYSIIVADLTGRITFCNRQTLYMHGFKGMEEIIGTSCFDLFAPECRQRAADAAQQSLINGGFRNVEYTLIRKDGSRFPAEASASLIVDKEGKTQGFVGVLWDVTERKLKENEIKIRADQEAAIAELGRLALTNADLSVLMDETVKLVSKNLNVEYSKVLELLPDGSFLLRAGIGWKDGLVGTAIVGGKIESQAGYTLLSHKPVIVEDFNTEKRFHKPSLLQENGVVSGMSIIIGKQDKPIGVLGAHTSKPRAFTRDDINFLESMANTLAEAIYQRQFEEMKEELEKMRRIESIGVLAGGIAHDFNNLLTIIMGNIFVAKRELSKPIPTDNNKILKMLTNSEEGCKNARDLSNMLITFSRGEMLMRKLISISELLKETTNLLISNSKNITCEFSLPDNLYVMVDKFQITQVINGIVANAIEAMPDGGIIRMMAENITLNERNNQLLKDGKYLRVSIEDTGLGIPKENLSKIFDLYFSTKDKYSQKGMGLGLSICYSIIKKHGGLITVDSKVGAGTTFHIYLPVF